MIILDDNTTKPLSNPLTGDATTGVQQPTAVPPTATDTPIPPATDVPIQTPEAPLVPEQPATVVPPAEGEETGGVVPPTTPPVV